jgi:excisionase family DNA binding protein
MTLAACVPPGARDVSRPEITVPPAIARLRAEPTQNVADTAKALHAGQKTVRRMCRDGALRYIVVGRRWRILSTDVLHLLGYDDG